jgi:hypothetical protein
MAILKILAVRDRAVDAFGNPFFCSAVGQGVRSFVDEVNRDSSPFHTHPEDYDLFLIGEYDESLGRLMPSDPRQVAVGKDVKRGDNHVPQSVS